MTLGDYASAPNLADAALALDSDTLTLTAAVASSFTFEALTHRQARVTLYSRPADGVTMLPYTSDSCVATDAHMCGHPSATDGTSVTCTTAGDCVHMTAACKDSTGAAVSAATACTATNGASNGNSYSGAVSYPASGADNRCTDAATPTPNVVSPRAACLATTGNTFVAESCVAIDATNCQASGAPSAPADAPPPCPQPGTHPSALTLSTDSQLTQLTLN